MSVANNEIFEYPIGERIRYFRERKHISTNKLANLAGISQSYLRDIELNNKNPTIEIIYQLCKVLDVSLKDFFDDKFCSNINDDPLIARIYRLNSSQREALLNFLNTIN